jgi:ubiquinone/menaquinone biosynthesis C-methylase UbiE
MRPFRSGDFLLAVLGLAAARDLFRDTDQVVRRSEEMRRVIEHPDEFPFDIPLDFDEHDVDAGYTAWSETYDRPGNPALTIDETLTEPVLAAAPRGRALDVACGTGRQLARLVARGDDACGVDATAAMAERARERCPTADVRVGSWDALPFEDDAFDLVTCSLALCHATELDPPVREMARVLRPGGWLVVSDIHPTATMYGGAAGFPGQRPGHVPFVRNHVHQLSAYFAAITGAGLDVRGLDEGVLDADAAATMPSHLAFPEANARAFIDVPLVVLFTAVKPAAS